MREVDKKNDVIEEWRQLTPQ